MNKRKIIKFGNSSFVITIPNTWLKSNNLDKGDEINFIETEDTLIYTTKKPEEKDTVSLNIDSLPLKIFNKILISYYLKNYKYIKIQGEKVIERLEEIRVFKEKLPSIEIYEIGKDYLILKDMSSPEKLDIETLIEKIVGILNLLFEEIIEERRNSFIMQLDSNVNKLTFLSYKTINCNLKKQEKLQENQNVIYNWRIISNLENIGDILKRVSRYINNNKDADKDVIIKKMILTVKEYFNFITSLLNKEINIENNLLLYLDKKQSVLKEIEDYREKFSQNNLNLYLLITQLLKDIIGNLDTITLSIIDLNSN